MAFRFRELRVYQEAKELHKEISFVVNSFPKNYYYLNDQLKRASLSVVLNIAEGSSKQSDKDFNRFITISLGSVDEVVACLEIALDEKLITKLEFDHLESKCEQLSKQLGSLSKRLKARN